MRSRRRFPFGSEPALLPAPTAPVPQRETAPLGEIVPPPYPLPFRTWDVGAERTEPVRNDAVLTKDVERGHLAVAPRTAPAPVRRINRARRRLALVAVALAVLAAVGVLLGVVARVRPPETTTAWPSPSETAVPPPDPAPSMPEPPTTDASPLELPATAAPTPRAPAPPVLPAPAAARRSAWPAVRPAPEPASVLPTATAAPPSTAPTASHRVFGSEN
jgi:hypothetical protein